MNLRPPWCVSHVRCLVSLSSLPSLAPTVRAAYGGRVAFRAAPYPSANAGNRTERTAGVSGLAGVGLIKARCACAEGNRWRRGEGGAARISAFVFLGPWTTAQGRERARRRRARAGRRDRKLDPHTKNALLSGTVVSRSQTFLAPRSSSTSASSSSWSVADHTDHTDPQTSPCLYQTATDTQFLWQTLADR
ncbi:hypothetical protein B0H13DRAFT_2035088 [Mycena leptocephala]|nr:hypothetical protein B0H13DRAFT_2035088 [Mycena leptocephala]